MLQSQDQCEGACTVGCTESIDWSSSAPSSVRSPDVDACAHDMEAFAGLISATQRGGGGHQEYIPINCAASDVRSHSR